MRINGYTLFEIIAVLAIFSMLMSTLTFQVWQKQSNPIEEYYLIHQKLRHYARESDGLTIHIRRESLRFRRENNEIEISLPNIRVFNREGVTIQNLKFDNKGRSEDIFITADGQDAMISGITGVME